MLSSPLEQLVDLVTHDDGLMSEVADIRDRAEFCAAVRALGLAHDIDITDEQIVAGVRDARTAWLSRWV